MEEEDDDFTFPTTVAEERVVHDGTTMAPSTSAASAFLGDNKLPGSAAAPTGGASSRLWPFAARPIIIGAAAATTTTAAAATVKEDDDVEEDRMDMLWDDTAMPTTTTRRRRSGAGRAEAAEHPISAAASARPPAADQALNDDKRGAAVLGEHERMDLLWESFNEELLLQRARSNSKKKHAPEEPDSWYLCPSPTSSEDKASSVVSSSPGRARYGCAPTMLRASSRAGGAAQFYVGGSPRRRNRGRGRGGGWALLLRLFRRLFAVDDDKAAPPCSRHSIHVP